MSKLWLLRSKLLGPLHDLIGQIVSNNKLAKAVGIDVIKAKQDKLSAHSIDAIVFYLQHQAPQKKEH